MTRWKLSDPRIKAGLETLFGRCNGAHEGIFKDCGTPRQIFTVFYLALVRSVQAARKKEKANRRKGVAWAVETFPIYYLSSRKTR